MTHIRLRWQKLGGHIHVGVWSGAEQLTTHGRNGTLVFRENEWEDIVRGLALGRHGLNVEIVHEDADATQDPVVAADRLAGEPDDISVGTAATTDPTSGGSDG